MAIKAQGSTLEIDATTPGTADVAVGGIKSFSGFDGEASEIDTTDLDSTAKEFLLGLVDNGSINIEFFPDFSDSGQDDLRANAIAGTSATFQLTLPDGSTADFSGYVKNAHSLSGSVDSAVEGSCSIKISGAVTWA